MDCQLVKMKTYKIKIIIGLLILLLNFYPALGIPPLPTEFYGYVQQFNQVSVPGTTIKAYDPEGNICGTFKVVNTGYYGTLTCRGRDNTTSMGDGPDENDTITFRVGTSLASALDPITFEVISPTYEASEFKDIRLVTPPLICEDSFCDSHESCATCPEDCGACPSGDGGGSVDTGDKGSGGGAVGAGADYDATAPTAPERGTTCDESWICADWSVCLANNTMFRECSDANNCGTVEYKPLLVENCTYFNETGLNITNRTGVTERIRQEQPRLITPCTDKLKFFSTPSLLFIMLYLLILAASIGKLHRKIRKIKNDNSLSDVEKLAEEFHLKKEAYIFIISLSVISLIVYLYHYFFYLCKENYLNHLWLLAAFIVVSPIIINFIIEIMKYSEDEKLVKLVLLNNTHYQHFKKLLEITNSKLFDIFKDIIIYTEKFDESSEFYVLLTNIIELRHIFKDINKVYLLYSQGKDVKAQKYSLISDLNTLFENDTFNTAVDNNPELNPVRDDLRLLYSTLNAKQDIITEIYKIEQEYSEKENMSLLDKDNK